MKDIASENKLQTYFIETYGCQMNQYDSQIVASILEGEGYRAADDPDNADLILVNTCAVRSHAEKRALGRISVLGRWKKSSPGRKLGVIGCMAQQLGKRLFETNPFIDFIVGPDQYKNLPELISNEKAKEAVSLNHTETYGSIKPIRQKTISGYVTISRGCNNFCSYCVVPFTRGRERSRPAQEILSEIEEMVEQGFKEVILLGQNVNSYNDGNVDFPTLLRLCTSIDGLLRIRFMTSHPKDLSDRLIETVASEEKICNHIHLPVQSGSNRILEMMNRKYTREHYIDLVEKIRNAIPDIGITTDIMVGFPGETENNFDQTYNLMKEIEFDDAFTYRYSMRPQTKAAKMKDQIPEEIKLRRLDKIITLQRKITLKKKLSMIGKKYEVLPERPSKQSQKEWLGKTSSDHVVIFPMDHIVCGQPVNVLIKECTGATLRGAAVRD